MHIVLRLFANEKGSAALEYAAIAALMSIAAIGVIQALAANAAATSAAL